MLEKYSLRDYQQDIIQQISSHWNNGERRVAVQLPTGSGKTVIFAEIASQFTERGESCLIIAHREELLEQAAEKIELSSGEPCGIIKAGRRSAPLFRVQIASIQTLARRRRENWPQASLVIIDEAHHAAANSYQQIFEHYNDAKILGFTATPTRGDGQGLRHLFEALILGRSTQELIADGYLSPFRVFRAPNTIATSHISVVGGDYNQAQLAEAASSSQIMGDLISTWRKYANGKKTVVFAVDCNHSRAIVQKYLEAGISAEHLDGETPTAERKAMLARFRSGETLILSNCNVVSEGFDLPDIQAVQVLRPTKSLILWLQCVGRSLRPAPDKDYALIIDHTSNWFDHGLPDEERPWTLDPVSMPPGSFCVECPECNHIFRPLAHEIGEAICPNCQSIIDLGEPQPVEDRTLSIMEEPDHDENATIEELNLTCRPSVMIQLWQIKQEQLAKNYKSGWVYIRLKHYFSGALTLGELRECAKLCGYSSGWAWHCLREQEIGVSATT